MDAYIEWLKTSITVTEVNGACEITTPFLDRHNDRLQIYVTKKDGGFVLSDDGFIISDLQTSGCSLDTESRSQMLTTILNGFGVRNRDDELIVEATPNNFPQKKHALLQAMMAVNDMFMVARHRVASLFVEDVAAFLDEHEVRYSPKVEFTGRSGFLHSFDFVIPKSRRSPERLVRAINNPIKDQVTLLIFAWNDTREVRPKNSALYAMLNDEDRNLSSDVLGAFQQYEIKAVPWSQRTQYIQELAA